MQNVYQIDETEKRKLRFLYHQSGIEQRYSAIPDFDQLKEQAELFVREGTNISDPLLEARMKIFDKGCQLFRAHGYTCEFVNLIPIEDGF